MLTFKYEPNEKLQLPEKSVTKKYVSKKDMYDKPPTLF